MGVVVVIVPVVPQTLGWAQWISYDHLPFQTLKIVSFGRGVDPRNDPQESSPPLEQNVQGV